MQIRTIVSAIMMVMTLGMTCKSLADIMVQINWTKSNVTQVVVTKENAIMIRVTSPAISGIRGRHTNFGCSAQKQTVACNVNALESILNKQSLAKMDVSYRRNCSPYMEPTYGCYRVEYLTLTFANGLTLQSGVYL